MVDLFLIAHKVRGEAAFDVALQMEVEGETMWIIPTSGHRAYPYWHSELVVADCETGAMPDDLPDHYQARSAPAAAPPSGLAAMLAEARRRNVPKIDRRGF